MTARNRRREHREMLRAERGAERPRGRVEREPLIDAEKQGQGDRGEKGECEEERTGTREGKKRPGSRAAVRPVPPGRHKSPSLRMDGSVIRSADHEGRDEWARAAADRRQ